MKRKYFISNNLKLSYLENGLSGKPVIICLHGQFGNARYYSNILNFKDYHVFSLDFRGHGFSQHSKYGNYKISDFLNDFSVFLSNIIKSEKITVIGHSLGGLVAYHAAALYPKITKIISEDIGVFINEDISFTKEIPDYEISLRNLETGLKNLGITEPAYFLESATEDEKGWKFRFDKNNIWKPENTLNGNYWDIFLKSSCPILLIHGRQSWVVSDDEIFEMEQKRPNTKAVIVENSSHGVNMDNPDEFIKNVIKFLQ
ncbi:alpha/beta hydrolase [Leptotrichia sp. OH3620_COT-345]|uniref:alpha/beta fold hydrolase n=1 Tax=Leptotrichia sp. OH3620_COT-345 TaxID=2491048 RepID=UPI000F646BB0|nr:alpha/beta hydrolase [Leptotrichia sp. OH3620_COT-345]RRD38898.1 alpha/beta hydrolase [Leptotrichia sp. OH3620_COT-345]